MFLITPKVIDPHAVNMNAPSIRQAQKLADDYQSPLASDGLRSPPASKL